MRSRGMMRVLANDKCITSQTDLVAEPNQSRTLYSERSRESSETRGNWARCDEFVVCNALRAKESAKTFAIGAIFHCGDFRAMHNRLARPNLWLAADSAS